MWKASPYPRSLNCQVLNFTLKPARSTPLLFKECKARFSVRRSHQQSGQLHQLWSTFFGGKVSLGKRRVFISKNLFAPALTMTLADPWLPQHLALSQLQNFCVVEAVLSQDLIHMLIELWRSAPQFAGSV